MPRCQFRWISALKNEKKNESKSGFLLKVEVLMIANPVGLFVCSSCQQLIQSVPGFRMEKGLLGSPYCFAARTVLS